MNDQSSKTPNLWYIKKQGNVTGPFPVKLIGSYLVLGRIDLDTMVSVDKYKWIPIGRLPSLIPDEVKNGQLLQGKDDLHQAKSREDERRGDLRRSGESRRSGEREEDGRRKSDDRRQNKEEVSASYLKLKSDFSAKRVIAKKRAISGLIGLLIIVSAMFIGFLTLEPITLLTDTDCSVKAGPDIDWHSCNKKGVNLVSQNLEKSNLHSTLLNGALLVKTILTGADLSYASLESANLSQATLKNTLLVGANLNNANLTNVDLTGANLSYADLRNATVSNVTVSGTRFDHAIWIDGTHCARQSIDLCIPKNKE